VLASPAILGLLNQRKSEWLQSLRLARPMAGLRRQHFGRVSISLDGIFCRNRPGPEDPGGSRCSASRSNPPAERPNRRLGKNIGQLDIFNSQTAIMLAGMIRKVSDKKVASNQPHGFKNVPKGVGIVDNKFNPRFSK
jgi:hypothetical protein